MTSRFPRDDAVSRTTSAIGLDEVASLRYHHTNIGPQLSKNSSICSLSPISRSGMTGFGRTDRTKSIKPTGSHCGFQAGLAGEVYCIMKLVLPARQRLIS
jgi:hypothetical protein